MSPFIKTERIECVAQWGTKGLVWGYFEDPYKIQNLCCMLVRYVHRREWCSDMTNESLPEQMLIIWPLMVSMWRRNITHWFCGRPSIMFYSLFLIHCAICLWV